MTAHGFSCLETKCREKLPMRKEVLIIQSPPTRLDPAVAQSMSGLLPVESVLYFDVVTKKIQHFDSYHLNVIVLRK